MRKTLAALGAAAGAALLLRRSSSEHVVADPPLARPVPAPLNHLDVPGAGRVAVYRSSSEVQATPVLLVHSVNAAASAYEMRTLFLHLSQDRPVITLDLPGFGLSERADRQYTATVMVEAISAVLDLIGEATHVVASSLGAEFAAQASVLRPDAVSTLTLLSPTGFGRDRTTSPNIESTLSRVLDIQPVAEALFRALTSKPVIRWFLARSFVGDVDPGLVGYAAATAAQPGAHHAPLAFIRGRLFTADVMKRLYAAVACPTLVLYDRDPHTDFADLPAFASSHDNWQADRIPNTAGLPHIEEPEATIESMRALWAEHD